MKKLIAVTAILALATHSADARAEAWMVKSSTLGCSDREVLARLDAADDPAGLTPVPPAGCVVLEAGERLLDQPRVGGGFDAYVQLQRSNRSLVFVRGADVVADPGIGSVHDER